jgi:acetyl esterase/lipase
MDIYLPAGRDVLNTPLVVMIHAGQWKSGDKSDMIGYHTWLKENLNGWAFASINYRLVEPFANKFPAQEQDVNAAINFLINLTDSFRIARKKIVVLGESAGGQLALLVANKNGKQKIQVGVGIGIPSNIEEWYQISANTPIRELLENVTGGTPDQVPLIYQNANVFRFASGNSPKTFLVHGKADGVIPFTHSTALAEKINSLGSQATLLLIENESHNFTAEGQIATYNGIISFLKNPNLFR